MYKADQTELSATVNDFETFCNYIDEKGPVLTEKKAVLGKKDLFELNALLIHKREAVSPNHQQDWYYFIDFAFHLATLSKLYVRSADEKGIFNLVRTVRKDEYDALNTYEKYYFLLETFWTRYDIEAINEDYKCDRSFYRAIETFARSSPGEDLLQIAFSGLNEGVHLFSYSAKIVHVLSFIGFCSFVPVKPTEKKFTYGDATIQTIIPTPLGVHLSKILNKLDLAHWNLPLLYEKYADIGEIINGVPDQIDQMLEAIYAKRNARKYKPLSWHISPVFPTDALKNTVTAELQSNVKAAYTFKVSLGKSVWRKIVMSNEDTLRDLHYVIQDAFEFDDDHLYSFFMDGIKYSKNAFHAEYCDQGPYVSDAIIGNLSLYVGQRILYLFDYGDSWLFTVQLLDIDPEAVLPSRSAIIESKGKPPSQYGYEDDE